MMSLEDEIIDLPAMAVEGGPGLAIDISAPLIKVLYRSKEGYNSGETKSEKGKEKLGQLRLITCCHDNINNILRHVIQKGNINSGSTAEIPITTCGGGNSPMVNQIQSKLGLRTKTISEFKGLVNSLLYLSDHLPLDEFILPKPDDAMKESETLIAVLQRMTALVKSGGEGVPKDLKITITKNNNTDLYPCIIMSVESEAAVLKVTEDGHFQFVDSFNGGRTFVGMSTALTGVPDFEELLDMAVRGNTGLQSTTDVYCVDMKGTEEDMYSHFPDDFMAYAFAKCITDPLEGVKIDDMVFSLLNLLCMDLADFAHLTAITHKVERVFFCGSFVSHPLVHKLLIKNMNNRVQTGLDEEPILNFHMLRHTSHLSAIGAYLNDIVTMETTDQHKE